MSGAINLLKPTGWSSSDAVVKVRGILRSYFGIKQIKVGHLGTLDPAGSGVLPILFGKATRLFEYDKTAEKLYRAVFVFGKTTDTLDAYGAISDDGGRIPTESEIRSALPALTGKLMQTPPQYSSRSLNGVRGYEAARRGQVLELPARETFVQTFELLKIDGASATFDIRCSGGTYVRSLCRDLAAALGTVAFMPVIIRLESKGFRIEDSVTIDEFKADPGKFLIPTEELIADLPRETFSYEDGKNLCNGVPTPNRGKSGDYAVIAEGKLYGICRDGDGGVETVIRLWE